MGGRYRAYPDYKDSGVEWLGPIPGAWSICGLWMKFELGRGRVISNEEIADNVGLYPVYSSQTKDDGVMGLMDTYDFDGDFITWTTDGANAGTVFTRSGKFNCTNVCGTLRANSEEISLRFYTYALSVATAWFVRHDINPKLMNNVMSAIRIPVLGYSEQQSIANFLDHETAKIDTLIDKQQQLIKLLKEKRQAVISHAVTKGLNPAAPMKDSGVEWLGEVPEGWKVLQIRRVISAIEQGKSPECENRLAALDEWAVLKTGCVNGGVFRENEHKVLPEGMSPHIAYEVKENDLLMSRASGSIDLIGRVAYVEKTRSKLLLSDKVFRLFTNKNICKKYLWILMNSPPVRVQIELAINGAEGLANNITKQSILSFQVALPPIAEQEKIVASVLSQSNVFERLIDKSEEMIAGIKERRTALISAAVTGKIDVRNWQPLGGGS